MDRKSNEIVTTFAYHATLDFVWSIWMSWFGGILVHLHSVWNSSTKLTQIPTAFLGTAQDHLKKSAVIRSTQLHNICHGWFTNPLWSVPKLSLLVFMVSDMSKDGFMQTLNIRFHGCSRTKHISQKISLDFRFTTSKRWKKFPKRN